MYPTLALREIAEGLSIAMSAGVITVRLIAAPVVLTPSMVVGDFTEADFSGYAAETVTVVGPAWDDNEGNAVLSLTAAHFQGTTGAVVNTIYGYWITAQLKPTGAVMLLEAQLFDTPIPIAGSGDAIDFVPFAKIGQPLVA
jgi:hypothetical protein